MEITELLLAWGEGDESALEKLMPLVLGELRKIAKRYMRKERNDHTLQTSDLVNEAYLKLVDQKRVRFQNRAHFFAIAAQCMRQILVDYARARNRDKRGGDAEKISISDAALMSDEKSDEILILNEALKKLAKFDERKSQIVELRYFGGLTLEEVAETLSISKETVSREQHLAHKWLKREMMNEKPN